MLIGHRSIFSMMYLAKIFCPFLNWVFIFLLLNFESCLYILGTFQVVLVVKNRPANARDIGDTGLISRSGRSPGGRNGNPLQYSCLENPHGQRSLMGYNPWDSKKLNMTEQLSNLDQVILIFLWLSFSFVKWRLKNLTLYSKSLL